MRDIGDVVEIHLPRQRHGGAQGGKTHTAGIGGGAPTNAADINRVGRARHKIREDIGRDTRERDAVGIDAITPAEHVRACLAGVAPCQGGTVGADAVSRHRCRAVAAADCINRQVVDITGDGRGARAGLHDSYAAAGACVSAELHLELVPANNRGNKGGQTRESGGIANTVADAHSHLHFVDIVCRASIFIIETHLQR